MNGSRLRQAKASAAASCSGNRAASSARSWRVFRGAASTSAAYGHHGIEVDTAEEWTVVAVGVELLGEHALGEWAQHEAVVGGHGVDGSALHDEPHNAALEEQRLQFGGIEVDET